MEKLSNEVFLLSAKKLAGVSLRIGSGCGWEGSFTVHVQVFDHYVHRFPVRADSKGNSGRADGVFSLCFISKDVAVIVLQRINPFVRTLDNCQSVVFLDYLNVSEELVGVGTEISIVSK